MLKKLLSAAVIVASSSIIVSAQDVATDAVNVPQEEIPNVEGTLVSPHRFAHTPSPATNFNGMRRRQAPKGNPFEGIELTAEQQEALAKICPSKGEKCSSKEECTEASCDKTPKCAEASCGKAPKMNDRRVRNMRMERPEGCRRGERGQRCENGRNRNEFVKNVKEILTPDQYVIFLENLVLVPENEAPAAVPAPVPAQAE